MNHISPIEHARLTLKYVRQKTDKTILFYSGGKDSITLLEMLSSLFSEVVCVFMYFIEGLDHQKPLLQYPLLKYKNVKVLQYPHWMISHYLKHSYFRFHRIEEKCPLLKLVDIEYKVKRDTGIQWMVNGAKKSDSLHRNLMLGTLKFDSINDKSKRVYPLATWKKADVMAYIKARNLALPVDYGLGKSNGMDLRPEVLCWLKANWPNDFIKVVRVYPFAEKLVYDYEQKHSQTSKV